MNKDYQVIFPSLGGVLSHDTMTYEGLHRPPEIARIFDRAMVLDKELSEEPDGEVKQKMLENYFHDLYGVLMKRISQFAVESDPRGEDPVKIMAMMQEFLKVKKALSETARANEIS